MINKIEFGGRFVELEIRERCVENNLIYGRR